MTVEREASLKAILASLPPSTWMLGQGLHVSATQKYLPPWCIGASVEFVAGSARSVAVIVPHAMHTRARMFVANAQTLAAIVPHAMR
mmetsp:Transcript_24450/g.82013  ORF Transcript_24450/g.82013 Transcript_24450/m.82013 type:complete len:87 (+) Transcript_24450:45-305(+)